MKLQTALLFVPYDDNNNNNNNLWALQCKKTLGHCFGFVVI
jgi:hypothetical protein